MSSVFWRWSLILMADVLLVDGLEPLHDGFVAMVRFDRQCLLARHRERTALVSNMAMHEVVGLQKASTLCTFMRVWILRCSWTLWQRRAVFLA